MEQLDFIYCFILHFFMQYFSITLFSKIPLRDMQINVRLSADIMNKGSDGLGDTVKTI